jgi:hypothetical protein
MSGQHHLSPGGIQHVPQGLDAWVVAVGAAGEQRLVPVGQRATLVAARSAFSQVSWADPAAVEISEFNEMRCQPPTLKE